MLAWHLAYWSYEVNCFPLILASILQSYIIISTFPTNFWSPSVFTLYDGTLKSYQNPSRPSQSYLTLFVPR